MTPDQFMLVLCIAIAFVGVLWSLIAWRRRSGYGRIVQGLALVLTSVGLYLSGLLELVWSGVKAVADWVRSVSPDTMVWTGVTFLGAALLAWFIAAFLNSRRIGRATAEQRAAAKAERRAGRGDAARNGDAGRPAVTPGAGPGARPAVTGRDSARPAAPTRPGGAQPAAGDDLDDMAEIEAILKGRGIQ